ncbi:MAG: glucosaminidase domain-containing protein [Tissierellia bacterium]|nr:glucosaminidase domain-containing protein [Tissierellia bacterium]
MARRRRKNKREIPLWGLLGMVLFLTLYLFYREGTAYPGPALEEDLSREEFFETYGPLAQEVGAAYDLYPSLILAQAALESNFGQSQLTQDYHNYFGIKGRKEDGVLFQTQEVVQGDFQDQEAYFRAYGSVEESFYDYGDLISSLKRYGTVREATSVEEAAQALYPAGYSTNPNYGDILIRLIEDYKLKKFD